MDFAENKEINQVEMTSARNWSDLPVEMKAEVVKYVDFKSSLCLRQTAVTERLLVDSRIFEIDVLKLSLLTVDIPRIRVTVSENDPEFEFFDKQFLLHIFKNAKIKKLHLINSSHFLREIFEKLEKYRFENLFLDGICTDFLADFLGKNLEQLKLVRFFESCSCGFREEKRNAFFDIPQIASANLLDIHPPLPSSDISAIFERMSKKDAEIGASINFRIRTEEARASRRMHGPEPVYIYTGTRLATSNPQKHIIFEINDYSDLKFIKMNVVPAMTTD